MGIEIRNARIYTEDCIFHNGNIYMENERIIRITDEAGDADTVIDAEGMYLIPGLVDLHLHGCNGLDFSDGKVETIENIVGYERAQGVTTICPATMTLRQEQLEKICHSVKEYTEAHLEGLAGMNLEGPFVSRNKCGAQNPDYCLAPDIEIFNKLQKMSGEHIKLVTVAPELEGAKCFIREISRITQVSIGHSAADYDTACQSFLLGARQVTHLYNGMNVWNHRNPGIPGAAFDNKEVKVELICDGFHLHPSVIRSAFSQFGDDRILLISDSTMAAGLPDGEYTLGGEKVICRGKRVTLPDGTLAGSASTLLDCAQYAYRTMKMPLESVVKCATKNPAKVLKKDKNNGSLSCGKYANILLVDDNLDLRSVFYQGQKIK